MNKAWAQKQTGFTIVELLVVIVVIGILASITIVSYNGVQERAKTASVQSSATDVAGKLEVYNSDKGAYPTTLAQFTAATTSTQPYYVSGITFLTSSYPIASSSPSTLTYAVCDSGTGYKVYYWNYQTKLLGSYTGGTPGTCTIVS